MGLYMDAKSSFISAKPKTLTEEPSDRIWSFQQTHTGVPTASGELCHDVPKASLSGDFMDCYVNIFDDVTVY
jgi:hypothetical protein